MTISNEAESEYEDVVMSSQDHRRLLHGGLEALNSRWHVPKPVKCP